MKLLTVNKLNYAQFNIYVSFIKRPNYICFKKQLRKIVLSCICISHIEYIQTKNYYRIYSPIALFKLHLWQPRKQYLKVSLNICSLIEIFHNTYSSEKCFRNSHYQTSSSSYLDIIWLYHIYAYLKFKLYEVLEFINTQEKLQSIPLKGIFIYSIENKIKIKLINLALFHSLNRKNDSNVSTNINTGSK